jgi:arabinogalactan oligomer/maltooligosaccharide transport system permease protein
MASRPPSRKVLFPTRVALILVLPSLILYLFFNIWPMIFSIGVAFTNADRISILPNPEKIQDLKNAISCAEYLKTSTERRENAIDLLHRVDSILGSLEENLTEIKALLDTNSSWSQIEPYVNNVMRLSTKIKSIPAYVGEVFDCGKLGYPTKIVLIPGDILDKLNSLYTISSRIPMLYLANEASELYKDTTIGLNLTSEVRGFFSKLETNYEGYLDEVVKSSKEELDRLELKYVGFENFERLRRDPRFYNSLYKTLLFVATSVPLKVSVGVLLALFYSTPLIYGRKALRALLLVPWALPFLLSAMTWKFLSLPSGQMGRALRININVNEWHAFLVYNLFEAWLAYPFIMTVTMGALSGVSKDVIEASMIDGAGVRTRLFKVVFPLIAKPVTLAAILTTGASLQAFLVPLVINGAGPTGEIYVQGVGSTVGPKNEMLIVFGYNKIMIDGEYGYAASLYIVVILIILIYVSIWFIASRKMR